MEFIKPKAHISRDMLRDIKAPGDLKNLTVLELNLLATELRNFIIKIVAPNGGHLGASLGAVELTLSLYHIFDIPYDAIIWDVGHQAYAHKLLTGRADMMHIVKNRKGPSGFLRRLESEFDNFGAGHTSTSISAALGILCANKLLGKNGSVVAVIGDGAMSAGMAFEALNNAADHGKELIVVLNDNGMSISKSTGALETHLRTIQPNFNIFHTLGFDYVGPIDGHDIFKLNNIFRDLKHTAKRLKPTIVHVLTEKGKGFNPGYLSDESYHSVSSFDEATLQPIQSDIAKTYTKIFATKLIDMASSDEAIVAVTAAMLSGTGLKEFQAVYPSRIYDVAIAEQHAVTFAAGLACKNIKPFVAIYSTFLQRAYDQIIHDVALQSLPVRFVIDRAGFVGPDGPTHAGSFDIMYLCNIPSIIVMAPADGHDLEKMLELMVEINHAPAAIRFPRGNAYFHPQCQEGKLTIGKGRIIRQGDKVAIISFGTKLKHVLEACDMVSKKLNQDQICTIIDARFAKPLDEELLLTAAQTHRAIITIEEGASGGFSSAVMGLYAARGVFDLGLRFRCMHMPDVFVEHGTVEEMYNEARLNVEHIAVAIMEALRSV